MTLRENERSGTMRRQLLAAILTAALPLAALSQGGPPGAQGQGQAPGATPGNGHAAGRRGDPARMEKRMRLARTLGLAEALDLDAPAALKLGDAIAKFDDRRVAVRQQHRQARDVLRRAAQGEKVTAADVDQAIQRALEARAQLAAIDRETVTTVTQGLTPEKKARAVLFLSKFQKRFPGGPGMHGPGMGPGGHGDHGGPGMGPGRGSRANGGGFGMGPGAPGAMMGMAPPPPDDVDDDLDD
jgi:hypothetical protein